MNRKMFVLVIIVCLAGIAFFALSAIRARKKSDDILAKFKAINEDLSTYSDTTSRQSHGLTLSQVARYNQIVLLIDSLYDQYKPVSDDSEKVTPTVTMEQDTKRLLSYIQIANKWEWDIMDSAIPDTIKYWSNPKPFSTDRWYGEFFRNQYNVQVRTYLQYLKSQAIAKMQK